MDKKNHHYYPYLYEHYQSVLTHQIKHLAREEATQEQMLELLRSLTGVNNLTMKDLGEQGKNILTPFSFVKPPSDEAALLEQFSSMKGCRISLFTPKAFDLIIQISDLFEQNVDHLPPPRFETLPLWIELPERAIHDYSMTPFDAFLFYEPQKELIAVQLLTFDTRFQSKSLILQDKDWEFTQIGKCHQQSCTLAPASYLSKEYAITSAAADNVQCKCAFTGQAFAHLFRILAYLLQNTQIFTSLMQNNHARPFTIIDLVSPQIQIASRRSWKFWKPCLGKVPLTDSLLYLYAS